jgi:hypothetical protein
MNASIERYHVFRMRRGREALNLCSSSFTVVGCMVPDRALLALLLALLPALLVPVEVASSSSWLPTPLEDTTPAARGGTVQAT